MGEVILKIYDIVEQKAGLQARMKLVQHTGISKNNAGMIREDDEMINGFKELALKITGINIDDHLHPTK